MSWIYVVVGIVCLLVLQGLRSVLALVIPVSRPRLSSRPEARLAGGYDLVEAAEQDLAALGFEGPTWLIDDSDQTDAAMVRVHAVFRHREKNVLAWIAPPVDLSQPNIALTYYTTALQGGRYAVTQVSDPYFAAIADDLTPAQTIAPTDHSTQFEQHVDFVAGQPFGLARTSTSDNDILRFAGDHMNGVRSRSLQNGKLFEADGVARPRFLFGIRILRQLLSRPKAKITDPQPIPAHRMSHLAGVVSAAKNRAPAQTTQWALLLISAALFVGLGGPLFGFDVAGLLLGVILFHELGHWVAMRAFGYRNPHITLLPLLGGVTIGHETDPSASKRAWVSLAGPLPGIIAGWALLYYGLQNAGTLELSDWTFMTAAMLLVINYLNVLPVPPLDGHHVLQALLPPRWVGVQAVAIFLGVAIGVYVAYALDFWPLALIAGVQLFAVRSMWREARLLRRLDSESPPAEVGEGERIGWLLQKLESLQGAPKIAAKRINRAHRLLAQLEMRPMHWLQGSFVALVFLGLVIVPVAGLVVAGSGMLYGDLADGGPGLHEEIEAELPALQDEALSMSFEALLADLYGDRELAAPASEEQLMEAEARIGRQLPEELRAFYAKHNGVPVMEFGPIEEVVPADLSIFETEALEYLAFDGQIEFYDSEYNVIPVDVDDIPAWWQFGAYPCRNSYMLVDLEANNGTGAFYWIDRGTTYYFDELAGMLRFEWVEQRHDDLYTAAFEASRAEAVERLQGMSISELIEESPQPNWFLALFIDEYGQPPPASGAAISAAEAEVGRPLPDDYRKFLAIRNGHFHLSLLPVEHIRPASSINEWQQEYAIDAVNAATEEDGTFTVADLDRCWIVGGMLIDADEAEELSPSAYWCPEQGGDWQYVAIHVNQVYSSFTELLRNSIANISPYF